MNISQQQIEQTDSLNFSPWILFQLSFRIPRHVTELMKFPTCYGYTTYAVCPRCRVTMEYEFAAFCDRCGQALDWTDFAKAEVVYPKGMKRIK